MLFYGRALEDSDEGVFSYKMREPLMEAIKSLEERGVFQEMKELDKEFDKNLILYGPLELVRHIILLYMLLQFVTESQ